LILSEKEIIELIENYEKQTRAVKQEALKISWYMRGGISYDDAMMLGPQEREIIADIVKENMETTKKSGLPFF
jgi:hypothetical protein